jgi:hypothetical protein
MIPSADGTGSGGNHFHHLVDAVVVPDQDDTYLYLVTYPLYDSLNTKILGTDPEKAIRAKTEFMSI